MNLCKHTNTATGKHYGFTGPVAHHPYTDENRAAHGGITYTETCTDCGMRRPVNSNGLHTEYGPWGESVAAENTRKAKEWVAKVEAQHKKFPILATTKTIVHRRIAWSDTIKIERDGKVMSVKKAEVEAAAKQENTGDGLPEYYSAVLAAAETK